MNILKFFLILTIVSAGIIFAILLIALTGTFFEMRPSRKQFHNFNERRRRGAASEKESGRNGIRNGRYEVL